MVKVRETKSDRIFNVVNLTILIVLTIMFLMPFYLVFTSSIVSDTERNLRGMAIFIPHSFDLSAYKTVLGSGSIIYRAYLNTFIRLVAGTGLSMVVTILAAYALSKRGLPMRKAITFFFFFTVLFNGQTTVSSGTGDKLACTHLAICRPPYEKWEPIGKDYHTRLDGPSLFEYNGRVYAVGRRNPYNREEGPNYIGSVFGRKRTSLYEVTVNGLIFLTDFPSAGDTSYGGCVLKDGYLHASYYSSPLDSDWPWYVGMLSPSDIRMVKIPLNQIEALADRQKEEYNKENKYLLVRE